jgi:hypothetical protein
MGINGIRRFVSEKLFFIAVVINVLPFLFIRFFPTMDGPAHLYNSNLIGQLLHAGSPLHQYFYFNPMLVPNWLSHIILGFFALFLPAFIAEKILVFLFLLLMPLSFYYMVKALHPQNAGLSLIILPFSHIFLFYLGFYNLALGFIFWFVSVGLWAGYLKNKNKRLLWLLFFLITLSYFTHVMIYGCCLMSLGFLSVLNFKHIDNQSKTLSVRKVVVPVIQLILISLPSLLLFYWFMGHTTFYPSDYRIPLAGLLRYIVRIDPIIIHDQSKEVIYSLPLFVLMLVMSVLAFRSKIKEYKKQHVDKALKIKKIFVKNDLFLFLALLFLALFFIVPDGASAGMMTDRFGLMFFILWAIWLSISSFRESEKFVFNVIVFFLYFGLLFQHVKSIDYLSGDAAKIEQAASVMEPYSVVLPVNVSSNWMQPHFSNYLGIDKPLVVLENYEASLGWFPLCWNAQKMPRLTLSGKDRLADIGWPTNPVSSEIKPIDYVMIYGQLVNFEAPNYAALKQFLRAKCQLAYQSSDQFVSVYKVLK